MTDLRQQIASECPGSRLTPLTSGEAEALVAANPGLPDDYVRFLVDVGYGRIGEMRLSIYGGPSAANNIYDEETSRGLAAVLLVGDDFAGYCVGYKVTKGTWTFGGVDESGVFHSMDEADSFTAFLRYWLFS